MSDISEAEAARIRAWPRHYTDAILVRCPRCGHGQPATTYDMIPAAKDAAEYGGGGSYSEACAMCGHAYEVGVEVEVTLVSPPREGGDRG